MNMRTGPKFDPSWHPAERMIAVATALAMVTGLAMLAWVAFSGFTAAG